MKDRSEFGANGPASRPEGIGRDTKPLKGMRKSSMRPSAFRRGLIGIMLISILLLAIAGYGAWYWQGLAADRQNLQAPVTPPTSLESLITEYPQLEKILTNSKIDSVYKEFLLAYETGGGDAALALASKRGMLNSEGDLRLTLELDTTDTAPLEVELEANFIEVTAVNGNLMDIAVPVRRLELVLASGSVDDLLESLTNLEHVRRIRLPVAKIVDSPERSPESEPALTFVPTPAVATPHAAPLLPIEGMQTPQNMILVSLAILVCLVAPALFFLGGFLLLMGFGMIRREDGSRGGMRMPAETLTGVRTAGREAPDRTLESAGRAGSPTGSLRGSDGGGGPAAPSRPTAAKPPPRTGPGRPPVSQSARNRPIPTPTPTPPAEVAPVQPMTGPKSGATRAQVVCLTCGRINRPGARFCAACGADLLAPEIRHADSQPRPAAGAEPMRPVVDEPGDGDPALSEAPTFCWNCGRRLRPTSRFCPFCGDRI